VLCKESLYKSFVPFLFTIFRPPRVRDRNTAVITPSEPPHSKECDSAGILSRVVAIHLFSNGNGRHARLAADLLAISRGCERFTWGAPISLQRLRLAPSTSRRSDPLTIMTPHHCRLRSVLISMKSLDVSTKILGKLHKELKS